MAALPKGTLVAIRETLLAATGSVAVIQSHLQLVNMRLQREEDRLTRDYVDTANVFAENVVMVLYHVSEMLYRIEQADGLQERKEPVTTERRKKRAS